LYWYFFLVATIVWATMGVSELGSNDEGYVEDITRHYLDEIGKVPLLSAEEEVELVQGIEAGLYAGRLVAVAADTGFVLEPEIRHDLERIEREGTKSKDSLYKANLRLVVSVAKRYQGRGLELLDLVQEGNLGLLRSVEKFDYTPRHRFATYATWWIRQAITRGLAHAGTTIQLPVKVAEQINKLKRIRSDLTGSLDREPTFPELAKEMGCDVNTVTELLGYARTPYSLSEALSLNSDKPSDQTLESKLSSGQPGVETEVMRKLDIQELKVALKFVDRMSQDGGRFVYIIYSRWGLFGHEEKGLSTLGRELGMSPKRVGQLETQAFQRLYFALNSLGHHLDPFQKPVR
jgi:RNA polymerase nonessential primary-like sigma factor